MNPRKPARPGRRHRQLDSDDSPDLREGASVAIVVLIFVFVLGFVLGAWLW